MLLSSFFCERQIFQIKWLRNIESLMFSDGNDRKRKYSAIGRREMDTIFDACSLRRTNFNSK